jgi:hypothetical protein
MKRAFLVTAFIAVVGRADNLYIVPVSGTVAGALGEYTTAIRLLNPNATDVTLTVDGVFPMFGDAETCTTSLTIPPATIREGITIAGSVDESGPLCRTPGALALRSTDALELRSDVLLFSGNTSSWQPMEIGRAWIPGGRQSLIDRAFAFDPLSLTNLFLVNPNPFPIHVTYRAGLGSGTADVIVPARRTLYVPLSYKFPCPSGCGTVLDVPQGNGIGLVLRSDFDYFASAISFSNFLPPVVRIAVAISP